MPMKKVVIKSAILNSLPVMAGYIIIGIGFGVMTVNSGINPLWAIAMSVFIYAGSMQYVLVGLLSGGSSLLTVAVTTFSVNFRHVFYGISMLENYSGTGLIKPYLVFSLTDETYSLVCGKREGEKADNKLYYFLVSLFDQIYWITGTALGVLLGEAVTFSLKGVEFALTALFVTVFTDQLIKCKSYIPSIVGVVASVICLLIFGADNFLIPSMALIFLAFTLSRKFIEKEGLYD